MTYEYETIMLDIDAFNKYENEKKLNELGVLGWELVSVVPRHGHTCIAFFKQKNKPVFVKTAI